MSNGNWENYRAVRPVINATGAFLGAPKVTVEAVSELDDSESLLAVMGPILLSLCILLVVVISSSVSYLRKQCCSSKDGMAKFSKFVTAVGSLSVVPLIAGGLYASEFVVEGGLGSQGLLALVGAGGALIALYQMQRKVAKGGGGAFFCKLTSGVSTGIIIAEVLVAVWVVICIASMAEVRREGGEGAEEKWQGHFFKYFGMRVERYFCRSYRNCCASNAMVEEGLSCTTTHEGVTEKWLEEETDPSREAFCTFVSGLTGGYGAAESGCKLLSDTVKGFQRKNCQENFCHLKVQGYEDFVQLILEWANESFAFGVAALMVVVLVQLEHLKVMMNLRRLNIQTVLQETNLSVEMAYAADRVHMDTFLPSERL